MDSKPTPRTIALRIQQAKAHGQSERYAMARANGYRGPVTRKELAAKCVRKERDGK